MFYTFSTYISILLAFLSVILGFFIYINQNFNYWKKRNVPFKKPIPIIGNLLDVLLQKMGISEFMAKIYKESTTPFIGIYLCSKPGFLVKDINLIKSVLIEDFNVFYDRTVTNNFAKDPYGSNMLFLIKNPEWKFLRKKMHPIFSSAKLKNMHPHILDSGLQLDNYIRKILNNKYSDLNIKEITTRYTTNVIVSTTFGIEPDCFQEKSIFWEISSKIFNSEELVRGLSVTCYFLFPKLVQLFGLAFVDVKSAEFLKEIFWNSLEKRREMKIKRNDMIDVLLEIEETDSTYNLEKDKIYAQALQYFVAGFESTSTVLSFALYELAKNQDIQEKLRTELKVIHNNLSEFTFDDFQKCEYLNAVIDEAMRKYPLIAFLDRKCATNYNVPHTNITLEKDSAVYISVLGLHYDPTYYPDPEKFDPDRFLEENTSLRPTLSYLPFGDGPRYCIGNKFGVVSVKVGLVSIIANFKVSPCLKTAEKIKFNAKGFLLTPSESIWLKFETLS